MVRQGSNSSSRKRSRVTENDAHRDVEEQPASKKTQFGIFPRLMSMFGAVVNDPTEFEEAVRQSLPPIRSEEGPPPMTDRERSAFIANKIDERHAEIQSKEADEALRDPNRKMAWNPDIDPADDDWIDFFDKVHEELTKKAVIDVLQMYFEEGQIAMIQPMGLYGAALQIQNEHAALYKANITEGGKYFGCGDNLTTKLTMLHFGLPVEPMTTSNIFRAGEAKDDDNSPDPEDEMQDRVERIYYAEKPLEFLDTYWERSYGLPILRRIQPVKMKMRGGSGSPEDISHSDSQPGIVQMRGGAGNPRTSPKKKSTSSTGRSPTKQAETTVDENGDLTPEDDFPRPLGPRDNFNRERILKQRAAEIKIPKYDPWMAEKRRQDRLQRESYFKDHQAILPGQKPEPPLFGMVRELMLNVTDAQPTIYSQRLTPTDINAILDENQSARNKILERMDVCVLCDKSFEKFQRNDWRTHLAQHAEQMASAGKCPICATEQWTLMNMDQKKKHIAYHQDLGGFRHVMWDVDKCPICEEQFSRLGHAEDVIYHLAEHQPGILRFCDRCGLEKSACSTSELQRHKIMCIDGPERTGKDPELMFCELCGKNRTDEDEEGLIEHRKACSSLNRGSFCRKCGLDMTPLSAENRSRHVGRCKPPRGVQGKHCQRCGKDKSVLDKAGLRIHDRTCAYNEKKYPSAAELMEEMKAKIERQDELLRKIQAAAVEENSTGVGLCPQQGCGVDLSNFAGYQIFQHMSTHLRDTSLRPPSNSSESEMGIVISDDGGDHVPGNEDNDAEEPPPPKASIFGKARTANDKTPATKTARVPSSTTKAAKVPASIKRGAATTPKPKPVGRTAATGTPATNAKSPTKKAATSGTPKRKNSENVSSISSDGDASDFQPAPDEDDVDDDYGMDSSSRKRKRYVKVGEDEEGNPVYKSESEGTPFDEGGGEKRKTKERRLYKRFLNKDGQWVYQTDVSDESIPSDEISSEYTDDGSRIPKGTRGDDERSAFLLAKKEKRKMTQAKTKAPTKRTESPAESIDNPKQTQKKKTSAKTPFKPTTKTPVKKGTVQPTTRTPKVTVTAGSDDNPFNPDDNQKMTASAARLASVAEDFENDPDSRDEETGLTSYDELVGGTSTRTASVVSGRDNDDDQDPLTLDPDETITPESLPIPWVSPIKKPPGRITRATRTTTAAAKRTPRVTKKTTPAPSKATGRKPGVPKPPKPSKK